MTTIDPALVDKAIPLAESVVAQLNELYEKFSEDVQGNFYDGFVRAIDEVEVNAKYRIAAVLPDALAEKDAEIERRLNTWRLALDVTVKERNEAQSRLARVLASVEALADGVARQVKHGQAVSAEAFAADLRALLADAQATTDEGVESYWDNHTSDRRCKYPKTCATEGHGATPPEPVEPSTAEVEALHTISAICEAREELAGTDLDIATIKGVAYTALAARKVTPAQATTEGSQS